jgi:hypothetical protein
VLPIQGVQTPPPRVGEKWFLDCLLAALQLKVKKPSGSENETRLVAAAAPGPGILPQHRGLLCVASVSMQAFRQLTEMT